MIATLSSEAVETFAAQVRKHLGDLSTEDIDELTDGLEADLAEKAADLGEDLGDPASYAEELRSAAGLPLKARGTMRIGERWARFVVWMRADPIWSRMLNFVVALRPVWWVARAWAIYVVLGLSAMGGPLKLLAIIPLVVVSVQWGRGRWLPGRGMKVIKIIVSTIAAIALPFTLFGLLSSQAVTYNSNDEYYPPQGLQYDGQQLLNIFPYDSKGDPISGIQLFDQDGNPLDLAGKAPDGHLFLNDNSVLVPSSAVPSQSGWNVFPLAAVPNPRFGDDGLLLNEQNAEAVTPPFDRVQPLVEPAARDGYSVSAPDQAQGD